MSKLGAVQKAAVEKKLYTIGYDCWLLETEFLADFAIAISPLTDPPLIADGAYATTDFRSIATYISSGKPGSLYTVNFVAKTTLGQQKLDELQMRIA